MDYTDYTESLSEEEMNKFLELTSTIEGMIGGELTDEEIGELSFMVMLNDSGCELLLNLVKQVFEAGVKIPSETSAIQIRDRAFMMIAALADNAKQAVRAGSVLDGDMDALRGIKNQITELGLESRDRVFIAFLESLESLIHVGKINEKSINVALASAVMKTIEVK
ncbi:hypothetical protein J6TS7_29070 [Paenibacillus dendritiformis]|uniref:hypothetical protein n=1 Tax=Paenibacillus TaxID=44249 RepID=UPI001B1E3FD1|nr:hypothetical protein [Paenibacillus dendritiformis]GIO79297.1 hypothetical protein J6TS7_29070 [Paenibacillus dendritiformis]